MFIGHPRVTLCKQARTRHAGLRMTTDVIPVNLLNTIALDVIRMVVAILAPIVWILF